MSSGNISVLAPQRNLSCGPVRVGTSYSKVWNGGNDPIGKSPQPYTMTYSEQTSNQIMFQFGASGPFYSCTVFGLAGPPGATYLWNANDTLNLISKLRERVVGSDFNLGIFLAESNQSLGMIASAATRIYQSYRAIRRGNISVARDIALGRIDKYAGKHMETITGQRRRRYEEAYKLNTSRYLPKRKVAANQHLEAVYGWIPLLEDARDSAEALAHAVAAPKTFRVRVSKQKAGEIFPSTRFQSVVGSARTYVNLTAYLTEDIQDIPKLHGMNDPLQIIWELTPYSFVGDWFFPISAFLEARGVASALKGTFVTSRKDMMEAYCTPDKAYYTVVGPPGYIKRVAFNRSVSTSLQVPVPAVRGFGEAFSWLRATNAVALVTQRVR